MKFIKIGDIEFAKDNIRAIAVMPSTTASNSFIVAIDGIEVARSLTYEGARAYVEQVKAKIEK